MRNYSFIKTISFAASFLLFFSGCERDGDGAKAPAKVELKRLRVDQILNSQPLVSNIDFRYDNLGRISQIYTFYGESNAIVSSDTSLSLFFSYNASGNLPYLISTTAPLHRRNRHHLSYNVEMKLIKDSCLNDEGYYLVNYSYANNAIYGSGIYRETAGAIGTLPLEWKDTSVLNSGNVVSYSRKNDNGFHSKTVVEYDASVNPLNNLNIAPVYQIINQAFSPIQGFVTRWSAISKNNMIKQTNYNNGDLDSEDYLLFRYNVNGLPTSRLWRSSVFSSQRDSLTYIYH